MMKKVYALFMAIGLSLFAASGSHAALFSDTVNFSGSGMYEGLDYEELSGSGTPYTYSFTQNVTFNPPAANVNSAQLTLAHHGNSNTTGGELWFLFDGSSTRIGQLAESNGTGWIEQVFVLPVELFTQVSGGSWSLALKLHESTSGTDKLWIDRSVLSGVYTPVPVPPALFLLGSGLGGIAVIRRRLA